MDASFSTSAAPTRKASRYTLAETVPTAENGRVGIGIDRNGDAFLVHEIGRSLESIALHAVATAVASGKVVPVDALVAAMIETKQLGNLEKAIQKAKTAVGA